VTTANVPLFPVHSVLFPGATLSLRIFEPRYTDMISQCVKNNTGFGICLITEGNEVGLAAMSHEVGTLANVVDWHMRKDDILGVVVLGNDRFKINHQTVAANQLLSADIEILKPEQSTAIPDELKHLVDLLKDRMNHSSKKYEDSELRFDDASWVGFRLAELLPLRLAQKQYFLELDDPLLRLERLDDVLEHIELLG